MRLTLRTMLAYMDGLLEPADSEDIGRKIAESEFATSLHQRTRDVVRRLRLSAPRLRGRGMGLDANSVAEYLDNTLSAERTPDFEKVCLESDVHLSEVASCHQILTLILGEPAEVDPAARRRMYSIVHSPEATEAELAESAAEADEEVRQVSISTLVDRTPIDITPRSTRERPEVPDYLREGTKPPGRGRLWVAAAATTVLIGGALWYLLQPMGTRQLTENTGEPPAWQGDGNAAENQPVEVIDEVDSTVAPVARAPAAPAARAAAAAVRPAEATPARTDEATAMPAEAGREAGVSTAAETTGADGGAPSDTATPDVAAGEGEGEIGGLGEEPLPRADRSTARSAVERPAVERSVEPTAPIEPADGEVPLEQPEARPAAARSEAGEAPLPEAPVTAEGGSAKPMTDNGPLPPAAPSEGAGAIDVSRLAGSREGIGRFVSARQLLLSWQPAKRIWQRLPQQQTVFPGDVLLSLPTYRSTVTLATGLTMEVVGATRLDLESPDVQGTPGLVMTFGRLVLMNVGRAGQKLHFAAGRQRQTLGFADAETTVALAVAPFIEEGTDPEQSPPHWQVDLYVIGGEAVWQSREAGPEQVLTAPAHRRWIDGQPSDIPTADDMPDWIASERLKSIEQTAARELEEALGDDRPVDLRLAELVADRKKELAALAVRALGYMDQFGPFLNTLSDSHQQAYWNEQIDSLRHALGRGAETAARVRAAFEQARGRDSDELYRMLWGFTNEQLADGADYKLIEGLDNPDQATRVLSFWNLRRISGGKTLSYRPEDSAAKRQASLQKWRQRFQAGQIRWESPEATE